MAPDRGHNRANEFISLLGTAPNDSDPEADDIPQPSSDDDHDDEETFADGGRDHYVDVGKSKLRQPKSAALGPQYRGSRVGRDLLDGDEDEGFDPFGDENDGAESSDEEMMNDETEDTDVSEDEADEDLKAQMPTRVSEDDRAQLMKAVARDQKAVASSLALSTKADAEKGRAVKKQRTTFDSLLNTRIKLQKSLMGSNTIVGTSSDELAAHNDSIEAAEKAAFALWSSLNSLRDDLISARTGEKRKRSTFTSTTPCSQLWSHMQAQEESQLPHRNATLQRWSRKARGATALPERGVMKQSEQQQSTIIDMLQGHLTNPTRLLQRAHTPRSCAPLQLSRKVAEDDKIYDDADFYSLLLKDLLEQKNSHDSAVAANVDAFDVRRQAKAKRPGVDTKASKGRKLRYTVHEKLQNFIVPEDRTRWGERATEELLGGLFGVRLGLGEGKDEEEVEDNSDVDAEGLMLFQS